MPIDFADQAQDISESFLDMTIRSRRTATAPFSGVCLHCGEPVQERRFCDSTCRANHEHQTKLKRITGV